MSNFLTKNCILRILTQMSVVALILDFLNFSYIIWMNIVKERLVAMFDPLHQILSWVLTILAEVKSVVEMKLFSRNQIHPDITDCKYTTNCTNIHCVNLLTILTQGQIAFKWKCSWMKYVVECNEFIVNLLWTNRIQIAEL